MVSIEKRFSPTPTSQLVSVEKEYITSAYDASNMPKYNAFVWRKGMANDLV